MGEILLFRPRPAVAPADPATIGAPAPVPTGPLRAAIARLDALRPSLARLDDDLSAASARLAAGRAALVEQVDDSRRISALAAQLAAAIEAGDIAALERLRPEIEGMARQTAAAVADRRAAADPVGDTLQDGRLREVWSRWRSGRGAAALPAYREAEVAALVEAMPCCWLYERVGDRFVARLVGREIERMFGRPVAGEPLERTFDRNPDEVTDRFRAVVAGPSICHTESTVETSAGEHVATERLMLPLAGDRGVSFVLGATAYQCDLDRLAGHFRDELLVATYLPAMPAAASA